VPHLIVARQFQNNEASVLFPHPPWTVEIFKQIIPAIPAILAADSF
jgi:hypothetical protein